MTNKWVEHVMSYAKKNKMTYGGALSSPDCRKCYGNGVERLDSMAQRKVKKNYEIPKEGPEADVVADVDRRRSAAASSKERTTPQTPRVARLVHAIDRVFQENGETSIRMKLPKKHELVLEGVNEDGRFRYGVQLRRNGQDVNYELIGTKNNFNKTLVDTLSQALPSTITVEHGEFQTSGSASKFLDKVDEILGEEQAAEDLEEMHRKRNVRESEYGTKPSRY